MSANKKNELIEELEDKISNLDNALDELRGFLAAISEDDPNYCEEIGDLSWELIDESDEIGEIVLSMWSEFEAVCGED